MVAALATGRRTISVMLPDGYQWIESPVMRGRWELLHDGRMCALVHDTGSHAQVTLNCDAPWAIPRKHGTAATVALGRKHAEWWAAWRERREPTR